MNRICSARPIRQAGVTLIEAAIVLGIVGLVVGGIWTAASSAHENMRQQMASRQLLALVGNIRNYYANSGAAVIDSNITNLNSLGIIPTDMVRNNTLFHQWGNAIALHSATAGQFDVNYAAMPSAPCRNFLVRNVNALKGAGLVQVTTGTGVYNATNMTDSPSCATGANMVFTFNIL